MNEYVIAYFGGETPSSPEEGKAHFVEYQAWLTSLGDAAISPMNPIKNTVVLSSDKPQAAGSACAMSGYTVIRAASMSQAIEIAKACPFLKVNGTLEVSELVKM